MDNQLFLSIIIPVYNMEHIILFLVWNLFLQIEILIKIYLRLLS